MRSVNLQMRTLGAGVWPQATRLPVGAWPPGPSSTPGSPPALCLCPSALVLSQGPPRAAPQPGHPPSMGGCKHPNTLPPCPQGTLPPSTMSGSLGEKKGDAERVILQKSKNKNAGMMTSGRARAGEGGSEWWLCAAGGAGRKAACSLPRQLLGQNRRWRKGAKEKGEIMGPGVLGGPQKLCPLPGPPPGCPRAAGGCRELLWVVWGWTLLCWGHLQGDSPQKEEPTARQGAAGLRDTARPSVGVPPGQGSHQASHHILLSCSPPIAGAGPLSHPPPACSSSQKAQKPKRVLGLSSEVTRQFQQARA